MFRKTLSFILALMMLVTAASVLSVPAGAQDAELTEETAAVGEETFAKEIAEQIVEELADTGCDAELAEESAVLEVAETGLLSLQGLMQKFPEGKYWNHKQGSANNPDGWSTTPCYSHYAVTPTGQYTCNIFDWGTQCYGFALKLSYDAFGSCFYDWDTVDVRNCKPGDVITYTHYSLSGAVSSHTFMVIERSGDTIRIGECNYDCHCMITWSRYENVNSYTSRAADATCYSAPRSLSSFTVAAPTLGTVSNSAAGITLTWNAVRGAAKYRVYYKGGAQTGWKALADTASTSYLFKNPEYQTAYTFTVRAKDSAGNIVSDYDRTGLSITYKFAPKLAASVSGGKIALTWDAVARAAKYRVYIKGGTYTKYTKLTDTAATSYNYTAGTPGTAYAFAIRCISSGNTFNSDPAAVSATFIAATPSITKIQSNATGIRFDWGAVKNAAKYCVFVKRDGRWKKLSLTTATNYTDTNVTSGTEYTYTVRCMTSDGKTFASGYNSVGWSLTYLSVPQVTKKENTASGVKLTWNAVPGAAKYRVFVKNGSRWQKIGDTAETSFTHTAAVSGTSYTYTVRCISADGTAYVSAYNGTGWTVTYKKP